jgi:hypothetical protein
MTLKHGYLRPPPVLTRDGKIQTLSLKDGGKSAQMSSLFKIIPSRRLGECAPVQFVRVLGAWMFPCLNRDFLDLLDCHDGLP